MNINEEQELKKEFQLERIILFSDAVFAIIVTIMVIELKFNESVRDATEEAFKHEFKHLAIQLMGYAISFFFVAMLWTRHVKLFGFLKDYSPKLLVYNLFFLFCVSLFPFAVSTMTLFLSKEGTMQATWGFNMYICEILLCMFVFTLLTGYLINNKEKLAYKPEMLEEHMKWKALRANYWLIPLIGAGLIVLDNLGIAPMFSAYIMAVYGVSMSFIHKHYYPKTADGDKPYILRMFAGGQKKSRKAELPAGD
jgi:uncharacterized membrane protein